MLLNRLVTARISDVKRSTPNVRPAAGKIPSVGKVAASATNPAPATPAARRGEQDDEQHHQLLTQAQLDVERLRDEQHRPSSCRSRCLRCLTRILSATPAHPSPPSSPMRRNFSIERGIMASPEVAVKAIARRRRRIWSIAGSDRHRSHPKNRAQYRNSARRRPSASPRCCAGPASR